MECCLCFFFALRLPERVGLPQGQSSHHLIKRSYKGALYQMMPSDSSKNFSRPQNRRAAATTTAMTLRALEGVGVVTVAMGGTGALGLTGASAAATATAGTAASTTLAAADGGVAVSLLNREGLSPQQCLEFTEAEARTRTPPPAQWPPLSEKPPPAPEPKLQEEDDVSEPRESELRGPPRVSFTHCVKFSDCKGARAKERRQSHRRDKNRTPLH